MSAYLLVHFLEWSKSGAVILSLRSSARSDMAVRPTESRPIRMVVIQLTSAGRSRGLVVSGDSHQPNTCHCVQLSSASYT